MYVQVAQPRNLHNGFFNYDNWENLKFIKTISTLKNFTASFVVSEHNYLEMEIFYNIIDEICNKSHIEYRIFFSQHVFWGDGAYTENEVKKLSVFIRRVLRAQSTEF